MSGEVDQTPSGRGTHQTQPSAPGSVDRTCRLEGFGVFREYVWPSSLADFKKFNLIYGWNRSGKTTLSRVFAACERHSTDFGQYPQGGRFEIVCNSGLHIKSDDLSDCPLQVRVFNKDFVDTNISFDTSNACNAIAQVSEEDIGSEKQLKEAEVAEVELQVSLRAATQAREAAERTVDRFYRSTALAVKQAVGDLAVRDEYYSYDKTQVERAIANKGLGGFVALLEPDAEGCRAALCVVARSRIEKAEPCDLPTSIAGMRVTTIGDVTKLVNGLLEKQVVAETIERLKRDPELNSWVERGLALHTQSHTQSCLFCQKPLEKSLLETLSRHFSQDYSNLQGEIEKCLTDVGGLRRESFEVPVDIHPDLADAYAAKVNDLNALLLQLNTWVDEVERSLKQKKENPLSILAPVDTPQQLVEGINTMVAAINLLVDEHNEKVDNHDAAIKQGKDKLAEHLIATAIADQDFSSMSQELGSAREQESELQGLLTKKRAEIAELRRRMSNIGRALKQINRHLVEFFGREEIRLELDAAARGYVIHRNDEVACNLSEGEKTAIAFSYFLVKTQEAGFRKQDGVVVIDDPISSLDSNFVFHCFSLVKNHFGKSGQLIVMTHNFELFNLVKSWFCSMKKREELCGFYMVENATSDGLRYAELCPLEDTLLKFRSEYHYLFVKLTDFVATAQPRYDDLYTISNVARRFLEVFASFKIPTTGDLASKLDQLVKDSEINDIQKDKVYKLINEYSHGADPTTAIEHKDKVEAQDAVRILLDVVKQSDARHFELLAKNA